MVLVGHCLQPYFHVNTSSLAQTDDCMGTVAVGALGLFASVDFALLQTLKKVK